MQIVVAQILKYLEGVENKIALKKLFSLLLLIE